MWNCIDKSARQNGFDKRRTEKNIKTGIRVQQRYSRTLPHLCTLPSFLPLHAPAITLMEMTSISECWMAQTRLSSYLSSSSLLCQHITAAFRLCWSLPSSLLSCSSLDNDDNFACHFIQPGCLSGDKWAFQMWEVSVSCEMCVSLESLDTFEISPEHTVASFNISPNMNASC